MIKKIELRFLFAIIFMFLFGSSFSQSIKVKGKVVDSLKNPLAYANILAEPIDNSKIVFAITDESGEYQLRLVKNLNYKIKISYLGYKPKIVSLKTEKDTVLDIILSEGIEVLDEVKIDAKLAVSIKKDTITYLTDKFKTGEERKLRDILKKLPGVEVDREGNVTVQGKRITQVLVENKQFFTGDSKLAVNNIPADVVSEVEVLDNYSDVSILKGLEDTNDVAMNIKLKEGKKKFWFGDIDGGLGVTDRYLVHPSIFYYSPNTSTNIIGDANNIGIKSFSFKDYLDFEGGYNKILLNPKAYFSRLNDDFSQFLNNRNFKNSTHNFLAASINQTLSEEANLNGYAIYSQSDNELESRNINEYLNETGSIFEERTTTNNPQNSLVIGKLGLESIKEDGTTLKIQSFVKASDNKSFGNTNSRFGSEDNSINSSLISDNLEFKQNFEWYKSISKKHTLTAIGNISIARNSSLINWLTSTNVFQNSVPIVDDSVFDISKDKQTSSQNLSILLKDYWVLSNSIHIYTTGGVEFYNDNFESKEFQALSNDNVNDFGSNGFGNDIESDFSNSYFGTQLKFQKGKFTLRSGLFYHYYYRKLNQLSENLFLNKNYFLPELLLKVDLKRSEKINIRYNLKTRFPSISRLIANQTIIDFNSTYKGDSKLENELYHQASIRYFRFSILRKLDYNLSVNYRKTEKGIRNTAILDDINFVNQPILVENADELISFSGSLRKGIGDFSIQLGSSASFSNYVQILNEDVLKNISRIYNFNTGLKTSFDDFPNIDLTYKKSFNNYKTPLNSSKFENDIFNLILEYDFLKNFIFNLDYSYQKFNNKTINNKNENDILNASLFFQKESSPWSFEITINNLFDNKSLRASSFSNFLISDQRTFILPRIIMFKIGFKL